MKLKFANALSLALIVAMLFTSAALADNVQDDVSGSGPVAFAAGGSTTIKYWIQDTGSDGCGASDGTPAVITINAPAGVTASPASLTFTACGTLSTNTQSVVYTSSSAGTYAVTLGATDSGGDGYNTNPANVTLNVNAPSDNTGPVITSNVSGTLGSNGWYTSDVTVSWSVVDNESAISSSSGCGSTTINSDTAGTTLTCSATSAGGTSSQSVTIKRDATVPTISGSASPAANGAGWNNTDVAVAFTCADSLSGIASCGPNATLSGEGTDQSATGTAVDAAGNSASATVSNIDIDKTTPTITGSTDRPANGNNWYNADVTVTFTCGDGGSGVASCSAPSTLGEGAGQSVTGTATDYADNSNSATVSGINIDKTAPTISASISPAAAGTGWYNSTTGAPTVSFSCNDTGGSGLAGACPSAVTLGEGADQSVSGGPVSDAAGNVSGTTTLSNIDVDLTTPSVALVGGPANNTSYYFGSVPAAPTCNASDVTSGLAACNVSGYSTAVGTHSVTATASDNAGNSASASATYTVLAWTTGGFYQPVDMGGVWNTVRNGSTVPLKFELWAGSTELTDIASVKSITSAVVQCTAGSEDAIETVVTATGGTTLRYDATAGQFIFNWKTPATANKCYRVTMEAQDGSKIIALFKLK
jgi:hypothetical protein